ncbi:MAG: ribosome silencing factor [Planctomycetes bacterium]|nr:ribosome silencing factor [Planctomycetota bacterium]
MARTRRAAVTEPAATERQRAKPTRGSEAARQFAIDCAKLMRDDKCEEIVVMDLRGISPICDFFVIANGTSDRQMREVADHIKEMGKERGEKPYGVSGYDESTWIVVDYVDVVIHLFDGGAARVLRSRISVGRQRKSELGKIETLRFWHFHEIPSR